MVSEPPEKRDRSQSWQGKQTAAKKPTRGRVWEGTGLEDSQRVARRNFMRRVRATGMVLLAIGLIASAIWLLIPREVATPLVAWAVTEYSDPVPVNAWAQEDLEGFERLWGRAGSGGKSLLPGTSYNLVLTNQSRAWSRPDWNESVAALREQLKKLKPGGPLKNVVVFYISAHGLLDDQGRPCLLPASVSGADASDPAIYLDTGRWMPVATLLSEIHKALPERVHKVVMIDAMRFDSAWRLGALYNGFADRVATAVRESGVTNLSVISAAGPGQKSWSSARLRGSAFGYFTQRAFNGKDADRNDDDKVTLDELFQYLKTNVATWVLSNCYDDQMPTLFSTGEPRDVQVAWVRKAQTHEPPKPEAATPSSSSDWDACFELWKQLDHLAPSKDDPAATNVDILAWESLRQQLLRLEQCLQAGQAYTAEASRLLTRATALAKQLQKPDERMAASIYDVNVAKGQGLVTFDDVELSAMIEQWQRPEPAAGAAPPAAQEPYKGEPLVPVAAAWRWAISQFDPRELPRILEQVDRSQSLRPHEPLEQRFLRMLQTIPNSVRGEPDVVTVAVGLRQRADEESACGGDFRTYYFVRPMLDRADMQRRLAEDAMFVGAAKNLDDARHAWDQAGQVYDASRGRSMKLRQAFHVRDQVWSDLPYLARWLARRGYHERSIATDQLSGDLKRCAAIFAANRDLAGQLEELSSDQYAPTFDSSRFEAMLAKIGQLASQQQNDLAQLRATFDAVVAETVDNTAHVRNWRENADLLETPLLSPRLRERLRRQFQAVEMSQSLDSDSDNRGDSAVTWIPPLKGDAHPALALLPATLFSLDNARLEAPRDDASQDQHPDRQRQLDQLVGSCKVLRDRLRAVLPQVHRWLIDQPEQGGETASARSPLSTADQLVRAAMSLVPASTIYDRDNAPAMLREYDTQRYLVWQGSRVLDDFWGPEENNPVADPYFVGTARRVLDAAGSFGRRVGSEYRQQATRLEQLTTAARTPITIEPEKRRAGRTEADLVQDYRLDLAQGIPLGVAAMTIGDPSQRPVLVGNSTDDLGQRTGCDLRTAKGQLYAHREPDPNGAFADTLSLDVWYRAHRASKPFHIPRGTSDEIVTIKPPYVEPRVTVVGDSMRAGAIAFVLDCSGSMAKHDPGTPADRVTQAKNELKNVLGQLAPAGTYRVSLWFYGHRVGVDRSHRVIRNEQWPEPVSPDILPSDDIELVWNGTLTSESKEEAFRWVDRARAWGYTPLYYAMQRVIREDLANQPNDLPRRLIVITDGENNTKNVGDTYEERRGTTPSAGDVVQAISSSSTARDQHVKVTLIGLGPEFSAVHARPFVQANLGIEFYSVANASQLIESMRKALQLYQFGVFNLDENDRQLGTWTALNQVLRLEGHPAGQRRHYEVRLAGLPANARLVCEGGELCELHLVSSANSSQLATSRFNFDGEFLRGLSEQSNVPNPHADPKHPEQSPAQFYVVARRPEIDADRSGATVTFSLSMQNQAADLFSPRPAEAWIEIVPLVEKRSGETEAVEGRRYLFYDLAFENLRPAPVLALHASRWPTQANAADVQLWFKMAGYETRAGYVRGVGELLRPGNDDGVEVTVAPQNIKLNIHVEVEPAPGGGTQVVVQERRDADSGRDVKVAVLDRRLRTADVIRHTSSEGRLVQHTFEFRNASEADVREYELRITSADEMKREAVTLRERPLRVRIPGR